MSTALELHRHDCVAAEERSARDWGHAAVLGRTSPVVVRRNSARSSDDVDRQTKGVKIDPEIATELCSRKKHGYRKEVEPVQAPAGVRADVQAPAGVRGDVGLWLVVRVRARTSSSRPSPRDTVQYYTSPAGGATRCVRPIATRVPRSVVWPRLHGTAHHQQAAPRSTTRDSQEQRKRNARAAATEKELLHLNHKIVSNTRKYLHLYLIA